MTKAFPSRVEEAMDGRVGARESTAARRWAAGLVYSSGAVLVVLLLIVAAIFARHLYTVPSLQSVADQAAGLGIVALGQMLVVLVAGIDMSVSAVVLLSVVIIVRSHSDASSIVAAVLISLAVGLVNGMVIALRRVPAFIATFAMLILVGGIELVYSQGTAGGSVPGWVQTLGSKDLGGLPLPLIVWLVLAAIVAAVLHLTVAGRWVYAVGTNSEAARFSGVPVGRVRVCCYVMCALFAFLGGITLAGYSGYVDQTLGNGVNLNSIAAVVIGGVAFAGGQGRVTGAISGVLVIVLANTIVVLAGLNIYWQYIVSGLVLILAVVMQSLGSGGGPRLKEWLREVATFRR